MNEAARQAVFERSGRRCEYCLVPHDPPGAADPLLPGPHVDHVIARQHGGGDGLDNLATACFRCNGLKGPNIAAFGEHKRLVRLFDPRKQSWHRHFRLTADGIIEGLTPAGKATARLLSMNDAARVALRRELVKRDRLRVPEGRDS